MTTRRKNGWFQRLTEAGSRTTYHGKIRGRASGKPRASVSRGKQRTYKGVQIIPLGGGEYTISIDRDSRFENARDAKKVIDHMKGNPGGGLETILKSCYGVTGMEADPTTILWAAERLAAASGVAQARKELSALNRKRDRMGKIPAYAPYSSVLFDKRRNPRGSKGKFQRCVESVAARGGAYDPRAVCGAMEKRLKANPSILRGLSQAQQDQVIRKQDSMFYAALNEGLPLPAARAAATEAAKREAARLRKQKNPAAGAIAVSEEFHGRKVKQMVPVQSQRHYHKYLADLGELRKLVVLTRDGKGKVTLTGFKGAMLTCNEAKDQLFITGGDQTVNPKDFGIDHPHEVETLGEVVTIEYFTDKHHLGSEGGTATYTHKFRSTNDNGKHVTVRTARNPDLIYHKRDKHLEFSGGSYLIRKEGIDL